MVERPAPHVGQRGDFDGAPFGVLLNLLGREHVVQGVVKRAQVGRDFFVEVAGQETECFAGFDSRAGEDDARDFFLLERLHGQRHRQVSLARASRADAKGQVVLANGFQVAFLADGFGRDGRFSG